MLGDGIERLLEVTEFFRKHMKNILLFACKRFEGIKIPGEVSYASFIVKVMKLIGM